MKEEKEELLSIVSTPKEEVTLLDSKLTNMTKTVRMMNKGTEILDAGKRAGDMKGIGFDNNYNIKVKAAPKKTFPPKKRLQEQMFHQMSQHHLQQQSRKKSQHHVQQKNMKSDKMSQHHAQQRSRMMSQHPAQHKNMKCDNMSQHHVQHRSSHHKDNKEPTKRCRYCRGHGHMRSECFKIHGYPHKVKTPRRVRRLRFHNPFKKESPRHCDLNTEKIWDEEDTSYTISNYENIHFHPEEYVEKAMSRSP
ncbi:unnamed protein product [Trifolium pratense]|uniref:Uncharacterized protein n=1 Tax=Trifolium pratense TaxID=57577 RepID=A0ACB0KCD1_TRIPR|nr:unnamed protein product [Trifolium pratense]